MDTHPLKTTYHDDEDEDMHGLFYQPSKSEPYILIFVCIIPIILILLSLLNQIN